MIWVIIALVLLVWFAFGWLAVHIAVAYLDADADEYAAVAICFLLGFFSFLFVGFFYIWEKFDDMSYDYDVEKWVRAFFMAKEK